MVILFEISVTPVSGNQWHRISLGCNGLFFGGEWVFKALVPHRGLLLVLRLLLLFLAVVNQAKAYF